MRLETVRAGYYVACAKPNIKNAGKYQQIQYHDQAHSHHRSRQRYIIGLCPLSRQRYDDLVLVKRIMSDRNFDGLGVGTQRYFEYVRHLVAHWGISSGEKRQVFGAKYVLVYIVQSMFNYKDPQKNELDCCSLKRTCVFEHKDPQKNALDCCWLKGLLVETSAILTQLNHMYVAVKKK